MPIPFFWPWPFAVTDPPRPFLTTGLATGCQEDRSGLVQTLLLLCTMSITFFISLSLSLKFVSLFLTVLLFHLSVDFFSLSRFFVVSTLWVIFLYICCIFSCLFVLADIFLTFTFSLSLLFGLYFSILLFWFSLSCFLFVSLFLSYFVFFICLSLTPSVTFLLLCYFLSFY